MSDLTCLRQSQNGSRQRCQTKLRRNMIFGEALFFIGALVAINRTEVFGCDCREDQLAPFAEEYVRSSQVLKARIVKVEAAPGGFAGIGVGKVQFEILESFKGDSKQTVNFEARGSDCDISTKAFTAGELWVLFGDEKTIRISQCGVSQRWSAEVEALLRDPKLLVAQGSFDVKRLSSEVTTSIEKSLEDWHGKLDPCYTPPNRPDSCDRWLGFVVHENGKVTLDSEKNGLNIGKSKHLDRWVPAWSEAAQLRVIPMKIHFTVVVRDQSVKSIHVSKWKR